MSSKHTWFDTRLEAISLKKRWAEKQSRKTYLFADLAQDAQLKDPTFFGAINRWIRCTRSSIYEAGLCNVELTLRRLRDYRKRDKTFYKAVMSGILKALDLPLGTEVVLTEGGGVTLSNASYSELPLNGWPDGHKITLNWILDIFSWAMRANSISSKGQVPGRIINR